MYRDNANGCWWITLTGLDSDKEYRFQYYTGMRDGEIIRIADAYSEKILDPDNDKYIPESVYPSSERVYPEGEEVLFLPSRLIKNLIRGGMNLV